MRPHPKVVKRCRLSESYGHRDTLAAGWGDPNDPTATLSVRRSGRDIDDFCAGGAERSSHQLRPVTEPNGYAQFFHRRRQALCRPSR
jgi:hypothetical protein